MKRIHTSEIKNTAKNLVAGEEILLCGTVYTARAAAHKRICQILDENLPIPFKVKGATIYYAGPTNAPSNLPIGSCGPTTSTRMDAYAPRLLDLGLTCMIGKGQRSKDVCDAIIRNKALYLCAIGGAGALAAKHIKSCEIIAFEDLGCESVKKLEFVDFPLIVAIDPNGNNIYNR